MLISLRSLALAFASLQGIGALLSAEVPHVFWASAPVKPDETVLVQGSGLGGMAAVVELTRLEDGPSIPPGPLPKVPAWTRVPVLQGSDQSLKFLVPATWPMGVFACRITVAGETSPPELLNAPDPWWVQGDEGEAASPGGWLRIFGKSLASAGQASVQLQPDSGAPVLTLHPAQADDYSLYGELPEDVPAGQYTVRVHNAHGGAAAWTVAGTIRVEPSPTVPNTVFSVLDFYGTGAETEMRKSLVKYSQPPDRTEGILAALQKAKENGGGIVYFPAGRYTVHAALNVPPRTILRGQGTSLVTLWWGAGHFNLDGGGPQGRARIEEPKPPSILIKGPDFALEDMSLFLPLDYEQGIVAEKRFRMSGVTVRIDHYWLVQGRGNGTVARLGRNFRVTDCDILAKGDAIVPGKFGVIAHNRIAANKSNTPMGGAHEVVVEDNEFISMDPTTYQNISGVGRNLYYARNDHRSLYAQQADYSFTFDAGSGAYLGALAEVYGTAITLAADPTFPAWALEQSDLWQRSAVFILAGRGAGQWRGVTANHGRSWTIDRAFDVAPDSSSIASIVSFNGRVLICGNTFRDANWVNAGYGTSIDVICAENRLLCCADLMNYGLRGKHGFEPSWHVQFLGNVIMDGHTHISSSSGARDAELYAGPITSCAIHRGTILQPTNSGSITIDGNVRDAIIENCQLPHAMSTIKVDGAAEGVLLRNNNFSRGGPPRYEGGGIPRAILLPPAKPEGTGK